MPQNIGLGCRLELAADVSVVLAFAHERMDGRLARAADERNAGGGKPLAPAAVGFVVGAIAAPSQPEALGDIVRGGEGRFRRGRDGCRRCQTRIAGLVPSVNVFIDGTIADVDSDAFVDVGLAAVVRHQ